jgi:hypothetical protein
MEFFRENGSYINGSLRSLITTGKETPTGKKKATEKRLLYDDGLGSVRRRFRPCRRQLLGVSRDYLHPSAKPASLLCPHDGFGAGDEANFVRPRLRAALTPPTVVSTSSAISSSGQTACGLARICEAHAKSVPLEL